MMPQYAIVLCIQGIIRVHVAQTYVITPELAGLSSKRKFLRGFVAGTGFGVCRFISDILWPSLAISRHIGFEVVESLLAALFFGIVMTYVTELDNYFTVYVSGDSVAARHTFFTRRIRRGQVRTVVETPARLFIGPGIRISKHGRLGTWFWGDLWIPKSLPEYEHIRNQVLGWKTSATS